MRQLNSPAFLVAAIIGCMLLIGSMGLALYYLPGSTGVFAIRSLTACFLFVAGAVLTYRLWAVVLDALGDAKGSAAQALLRLVGGIDMEGRRADGSQYRLTGVGLLGTFAIFVAVVVIIYLLTPPFGGPN